jgi:NADP-dependent 3-hydroxy acid dehydrogenase YdfG
MTKCPLVYLCICDYKNASAQSVALVTGGATGIGLATAQEFHKRGHPRGAGDRQ